MPLSVLSTAPGIKYTLPGSSYNYLVQIGMRESSHRLRNDSLSFSFSQYTLLAPILDLLHRMDLVVKLDRE